MAAEEDVIVSSEYLDHLSAPELEAFHTLTQAGRFDAVRVLVYFREPGALYLSRVQQRLKAASRFPSPQKFRFRYVEEVLDSSSATPASFESLELEVLRALLSKAKG